MLCTPLPRAGFAVPGGHGGAEGEGKGMAPLPSVPGRSREEGGAMHGQNEENEGLKAGVSCAALLERLPSVWRLDRAARPAPR